MKPEDHARPEIDRQLAECGWVTQNSTEINLSAGVGISVREFPLDTAFADYLLYVCGRQTRPCNGYKLSNEFSVLQPHDEITQPVLS